MKIFELCHSGFDGDGRRFFSHEYKTEADFRVDVLKGLRHIATLVPQANPRLYIGTNFFYERLPDILLTLGYQEVLFSRYIIDETPIIQDPKSNYDIELSNNNARVKSWMSDEEFKRILRHNENVIHEINKSDDDTVS